MADTVFELTDVATQHQFNVKYTDNGDNTYSQAVSGVITKEVVTGSFTTTVVSVATSSTRLVAANAARKGLIIQNLGAYPVTVDLSGNAAVLNTGVILNPYTIAGQSGGSLIFDINLVPISAIYAIAATGSCNVSIEEAQ